jgi:hypothetical protein
VSEGGASSKGRHGGRRDGAGRPKLLSDDMIFDVGEVCEALQIKAYWRRLEAVKQAINSEKTNLPDFYEYINSIPVEKRPDFLKSQEFIDHRRSIDAELKHLGQSTGTDGKSSRFLEISQKRIYGVNEVIYSVVGEYFQLSRNQVRRCWAKYRKLKL